MNKGASFHRLSLEERFLDVFRLGALQVGRVASCLQNEVRTYHKEGHHSPEGAALTAIDLVSQDILLYLVHKFLPGLAIDAEEDTDLLEQFPKPQPGDPFIVIDPIDGTLNYTRGSKDYAVMGALIHHNLYTAVLIYYPALKEMYWAQQGRGAWGQKDGAAPFALHTKPLQPHILVPPHVSDNKKQLLSNSNLEFSISRCSGTDAIAPAIGRAKASIAQRRLDRRRCIGFLITLESGGCVLVGKDLWHGQDPLCLPDDHGLNIVADSYDYAHHLLHILKGSSSVSFNHIL
jgi:fructose-1,6-bisphosphatase/inositol monophosphatase family enzyme